MKLSKICTLTAVIIGFSITMVPAVQAVSINGAVDKVVKYISKKGSSKMCRKGSIMNGIISIRSFSGLLCGASPALAGLAVGTCYSPNTEKFRDSGCYKKAKSKLDIKNGMSDTEIIEIAIAAMARDISKSGSAVAKIACKKASDLPSKAGELAKSKCPA